jgi:hypothetical protein
MGDFDSQVEAYANQLERQAEREAERADAARIAATPRLSEEEERRRAELSEQRKSLELARASLAAQLPTATSDRYREHIERSIAALDEKLAALAEE